MKSVSDPAANPRAWIEVHGILYLDPEGAEFFAVDGRRPGHVYPECRYCPNCGAT